MFSDRLQNLRHVSVLALGFLDLGDLLRLPGLEHQLLQHEEPHHRLGSGPVRVIQRGDQRRYLHPVLVRQLRRLLGRPKYNVTV